MGRLPDHQTVGTVTHRGKICDKNKPCPSVGGGKRLHLLQGDLLSFLIHKDLVFLQIWGFHLHLKFSRKGIGIEYHDRLHPVFHGNIDVPGYGLHRRIQASGRRIKGGSVAFPCILISRFDGCPRHNVMELIKKNLFPTLRISFQRISAAGPVLRCHRKLLRHDKTVFGKPVQLLHFGVGAVAPAGMVEQLSGYHRECFPLRLYIPEIIIRRGHDKMRHILFLIQFPDAFDIPFGGAAAMVSHAVKAHDASFLPLDFPCAPEDMLLQFIGPGTIFKRNAEGRHPGSIVGSPLKKLGLYPFFMASRAHEYIIVHSLFLQDLGQHAVMTEAVHVIAGMCGHSQLFPEITLSVQPLAHKGFSPGRVAVRLHPPAPHDNPASFLYSFPDFFKHGRFVFLHPFIMGCRTAGKKEIVVFLHSVQGGSEGGFYFLAAFLPLPEPHDVQVGVAYHI